jgi:hypothetical protein
MSMTTFIIFYGLFFVLLGFLTKAYPNLIAGYNTMPPEKKKNVDVEGLSTLMRNGMILIGLIVILAYFAMLGLGLGQYAEWAMVVVPTAGVILMLIRAQRFDHN